MDELNLQIAPFVRIDLLQVILVQALSIGNFLWIVIVWKGINVEGNKLCGECLANCINFMHFINMLWREEGISFSPVLYIANPNFTNMVSGSQVTIL